MTTAQQREEDRRKRVNALLADARENLKTTRQQRLSSSSSARLKVSLSVADEIGPVNITNGIPLDPKNPFPESVHDRGMAYARRLTENREETGHMSEKLDETEESCPAKSLP